MIAAIYAFRRRAGTGLASLALATSATLPVDGTLAQTLQLNDREYFTTPGVDVLRAARQRATADDVIALIGCRMADAFFYNRR